MSEIRIIDVHQSVFAVNDAIAEETRRRNREHRTYMINLMASPGAGKTTLLLKLIPALKERFSIGVMEADIDASVDAEKMAGAGVRSIQVHTGGECAMDAEMTRQAIEEFSADDLDLLIMENVGNLVCPAETDTGATLNLAILSVPEGDDKPLKYPLMFKVTQAVVISKTDTREYFPFDDEAVVRRIHACNPDSRVFFVSAKTGEGMEDFTNWLINEIENEIR